jgi:hypothetical protein
MLIVLQNYLLTEHRQAMLTPTSLRIVPALARHVDVASPEPLANDRDPCSGLIAKRHGGGILSKFMEAEHVVKTRTTCPATLDAVGGIFRDGGAKLPPELNTRGQR